MCTVHTTNNPPFYQLSGQIPTVWVGKPWSEHGSPVIVVGSASDSALALVHCVSEATFAAIRPSSRPSITVPSLSAYKSCYPDFLETHCYWPYLYE